MKRLRWVLLVVGISLPAAASAAPLLLEENFSYAAGTLLTADGWTNHGGTTNFIPVTASGLSYPGYPAAGIGSAASMLTSGEDVHPCPQPTGSCFVWNNDGQSTCLTGVTEAQCQAQAGWQHGRFIPGGTVSDIGLPVSVEPDTDDIDGDPATLTIRWRYVVMVDDCRIVGDECQERHRLLRCWKDDDHGCTNIQELVDGQWVADAAASAEWVTVFTGCNEDCGCEDVDQVNYAENGGCDRTNFHYLVRCVHRMPGFTTWIADTDPGGMSPPGGPYFQVDPTGVSFPGAVGGRIWINRENISVPEREKSWTVEIVGPDADKFGVQAVHGYVQGAEGPAQEVPLAATTGIKDEPGPPKKRTFTFRLRPQPAWEVVELVRTGSLGPFRFVNMVVTSYSHCTLATAAGQGVTWVGQFGVRTETTPQITQVLVFPLNVSVNPSGANSILAPPHSGVWTSAAVFVDPDGYARPHGGMRWASDGTGLLPIDEFSLYLVMTGAADNTYDTYAYDVDSGTYQRYRMIVDQDPIDAPEPGAPSRGEFSVRTCPNPFSVSTRVACRMPNRGHLSLRIYNVRGELVRTLVDKVVDSGDREVVWDGMSDDGRTVASGVYICRAEAAGAVTDGTILLIK